MGLGVVAVGVGLLIGPYGDGDVAKLIEVPGLLDNLDVSSFKVPLAGYLVGQSLLHALVAGDVLDLCSVASGQGYVGVHPHRSFQVPVEDVQVLQNGPQLVQEDPGLLGRAQIGLCDHFQQRHAAPVVIDHRVLGLVNCSCMNQTPGVLLHVGSSNSYLPLAVIAFYQQMASCGQRIVVLADLRSLGQIRIVVVLPVEESLLLDLAVQGQTHPDAVLNSFLVENRQGPGQPQAHRTCVSVGLVGMVFGRTSAEHLGVQLV
ncbi:Uncharacterised protein [uncultured archaeon]|nr:Uncharacterised protein [uncultured archaeon]